ITGGSTGVTGGTGGGTGGIVGTGGGTGPGGTGTGGIVGTGGDMGTGGDVGTGGTGGTTDMTCPLPSSFEWTSSGPLTEPAQNNWFALKDFSVTRYNDKYIVYGTVADGNWNGFFS